MIVQRYIVKNKDTGLQPLLGAFVFASQTDNEEVIGFVSKEFPDNGNVEIIFFDPQEVPDKDVLYFEKKLTDEEVNKALMACFDADEEIKNQWMNLVVGKPLEESENTVDLEGETDYDDQQDEENEQDEEGYGDYDEYGDERTDEGDESQD